MLNILAFILSHSFFIFIFVLSFGVMSRVLGMTLLIVVISSTGEEKCMIL